MANGETTLDLTSMGIDKVLGSGQIRSALTVIVSEASARAVEKIEAAGGTVEASDDEWGDFEEE